MPEINDLIEQARRQVPRDRWHRFYRRLRTVLDSADDNPYAERVARMMLDDAIRRPHRIQQSPSPPQVDQASLQLPEDDR